MFILYKRNSYFLTFALCCLLVGLAAFWSGGRTVALFLPNLSWFVSIAVEYLISIFTLVFFTAFLCGMQPVLLNKWAVRAYYAYSGLYALLVLFTEPRFYTGLLFYFQIGVGLFFLYIFWRLLKNLRRRRLEEALLFAGVAVFLFTSIMEAFFNSFSNWLYIHLFANVSQSGMMVFVFINMMALALQFSRTEGELAKERGERRELSLANARLREMKVDRQTPDTLALGTLALDALSFRASVMGRDLNLTQKEFGLLLLLAQNNVPLDTKAIYERVWNQPLSGDTSAIRTALSRVRRKLETTPGSDVRIVYARGEGYKLEVIALPVK